MKWQRVTIEAPTNRGNAVIGIGKNGVISIHSMLVIQYNLATAKYVNLYVDNPASPRAIAFEFPIAPDSASYPIRIGKRTAKKKSYFRQFSAMNFIKYYQLQEFMGKFYEPSKSGEYLVISLNDPVPTPQRVETALRIGFQPEHR